MSSKVGIVGGGSAGARKANNGIHDIPSGSRRIVQSLKEIVNAPEAEIYAMLKECNMDPNETVNRLLSQGSSFFSTQSSLCVGLLKIRGFHVF